MRAATRCSLAGLGRASCRTPSLARVRRLAARCGANASTELHCGNVGYFVFRDTCGEDKSDRGFEPESKPSTRAVGRVVTAMVDVRKNPEALMQCVSTFCGSSPLYKSDGVDLLVVARFLHRPLFEHMNPCASSSKVEVAMDKRAQKLPRCDTYDSKSDATGTSSGLVAPGGVVVTITFSMRSRTSNWSSLFASRYSSKRGTRCSVRRLDAVA